MESVYHGSNIGNITKFKKEKSTHGIECVYASTSEVIALIYASRAHGDLNFVVALSENGIPYIVERREGLFLRYYNRDGYIYELDGSTFEHMSFLWDGEVISKKDVTIKNIKHIDNLLEALKEHAKKGEIVLYRYPSRPSFIPLDNSDLIDKYFYYYKKGFSNALDMLLSYYPEFKKIVNERLGVYDEE